MTSSDSKKVFEVSQENVGGLLLTLSKHASAAAITYLTIANLDNAHRVTCERVLDGKVMGEIFDRSLYEIFCISAAGHSDADDPIFEVAASVKIRFDFGTSFVLKDGEVLRFTLTNAVYDTYAFAYTVETVPAIGLQAFIPKYDVLNLDPALSKHTLQLGNDVFQVIVCGSGNNNDITAVRVKSDKFNADITPANLYDRMNRDNPIKGYLNKWPLPVFTTGVLLNNVELIMNNTAGANRRVIVVRKIQTPEIVNNYQAKTIEHVQENVKHVKNNDGACNSCK